MQDKLDVNKNYTEEELAPLLTDEFLALLAIAVKVYGFGGDFVETSRLAYWAYAIADKVCPDLTPYDDE